MKKYLFAYKDLPKNKNLVNKARELRKAGVLSEVLFWNAFKNSLGWDIDRQIIIGNYIVDFLIPELGLIFEIDGITHDNKIEYDEHRDNYLHNLGLKVVHFNDRDVKTNIDGVEKLVKLSIHERIEELE